MRGRAALAAALLIAGHAHGQTAAAVVRPGAPIERAIAAYQAQDYVAALLEADRAAQAGDAEGMTLAALLVERGLGVPKDEARAVRLYRQAAAKGQLDALLGLARLGAAGRGGAGPSDAKQALERALAAGREDAAGPMGDLVLSGRVGPRDAAAALALYRRGAAAGDADAAYAAAVLLNDGDPAPPDDPADAMGLLKQAAEGGRADAAADYGLMLYQAGKPAEAAPWFRSAAERGDAEGAFYWALVNARGEGVARDLATAWTFAQRARGSSAEADRLYAALERARR